MIVRIRTVSAAGDDPASEIVLDVPTLRLGRGADLDLRGPLVPPDHSEITLTDGALRIRAGWGHSIEMRGRSVQEATLPPGTVFHVGTNAIRVLRPRPGEDALLEVREPDEQELTAEATELLHHRLRWNPTLRHGWGLVACILVLGLLWAVPQRLARRPAARAFERFYDVGHLSAAHAHLADRCPACHADGFAGFSDASCRSENCHPTVGRHGRPERNAADAATCASCHPEHDGPERLVDRSDAFCAGCHGDLAARHPDWALLDAAAFVDHHPEFRPSVVVQADPLRVERISLTDESRLRERSGLAFSHAKHLVPNLRSKAADRRFAGCGHGREAAEGRSLACADCHVPDANTDLMQPISFRAHCQSCHDLTPSCAAPEYELEHGRQPPKVVRELGSILAAERAGTPDTPGGAPPARRRPDSDSGGPPAKPPVGVAVADFLGENGVCVLCHTVAEWTTFPGLDGRIAARLTPVHLVPGAGVPRWLPLAGFTHRPHVAAVDGDCTSCHDARSAQSSEAVLLPGIDRCRECHGRASERRAAAPAGCVVCHRYHLDRPNEGTNVASGGRPLS